MTPRSPSGRRRRTLRVRLTAGIVALLTAAGVTIAVVTVVGLHRFLISQVDLQLQSSLSRVVDGISGRDDDDGSSALTRPDEVTGLTAGTLIVSTAEGTVRAYVVAVGATELAAQDLAELTQVPTGDLPSTVELSTGDYRALASPVGHHDDQLLIAIPLRDVNLTTAKVLALEGIVFAGVITVAGIGAALFVGRSLEPLRRVVGTANRVADLPLGAGDVHVAERAADVDPDTEVGQVGTALNLLLDHVEASFAQRHATEERLRQFVADASHELRTPVAVISGYLQLAQRDSDELPPSTVKSLDRIEAETARMALLVDDLLLLARLDSGRPLARDQVDLSRLAIDIVDDARAAGQRHRWRLDLPEDSLVVVGDEQRLHQALANLTANARAHTPDGSTVTVVVRQDGPEWVQVEVLDDGPGIPPELQPTLFERFVRGEASRSRATGGSGLGLAIVAAVIAAHGGRVTVTSEPGDTRFTITLPVSRPSHHPASAPRRHGGTADP